MAKDVIVVKALCPHCGAFSDNLYMGGGVWKCLVCRNTWTGA